MTDDVSLTSDCNGRVTPQLPEDPPIADALKNMSELKALLSGDAGAECENFKESAKNIYARMETAEHVSYIYQRGTAAFMEEYPDRFAAFLRAASPQAKAILDTWKVSALSSFDRKALLMLAHQSALHEAASKSITNAELNGTFEYFSKTNSSCDMSKVRLVGVKRKLIALLTTIQLVLSVAPGLFPGIIGAINVIRNSDRSSDYGMPTPKQWKTGEELEGFPVELPMDTYVSLLTAFGMDRSGKLHHKFGSGKMPTDDSRTAEEVVKVMRFVDALLTDTMDKLTATKGKRKLKRKDVKLSRDKCQVVASEVFGIHHLALCCNDQCCAASFYPFVEKMGNRIGRDTTRKEFLDLFRQHGKEAGSQDSQLPEKEQQADSLLAEIEENDEINEMLDSQIDVNGFSYGIPDPVVVSDDDPDDTNPAPSDPKPNPAGKGRKRAKKVKDFGVSNPKHFATAEICDALARLWNGNGHSIDEFTRAGRTFREHHMEGPLVDSRDLEPEDRIKIKVVRLGKGDAPVVLEIKNAVTEEFANYDIKASNCKLLCQNTQGDGNTSTIGAFYHCNHCCGNKPLQGGFQNVLVDDDDVEGDEDGRMLGAEESCSTEIPTAEMQACETEGVCAGSEATGGDRAPSNTSGGKRTRQRSSKRMNRKRARQQRRRPHVKVGCSNSVVSTDADTFDRVKHLMSSEFNNYIIDEVNRVIAIVQGLSVKEPAPGQVKVRYLLSTKFATDLAKKINSRYRGDLNHLKMEMSLVPRCFTNLSIVKIGARAKFDKHQDKSEILNSTFTNKRQCTANDGFLPLAEDMPVFTLVTGIGRIETEVEWVIGNTVIGKATTNNRDAHCQLLGVQAGDIHHRSANTEKKKKKGKAGNTNIISCVDGIQYDRSCRKIETMRTSACPSCDADVYLDGVEYDGLSPGDGCQSKNPYNRYNITNSFIQMKCTEEAVEPVALCDGTEEQSYLDALGKRTPPADQRWENYKPPERFAETKLDRMEGWLNGDYAEFFFTREPQLDGESDSTVRKVKRLEPTVGLHRRRRWEHLSHVDFVLEYLKMGLLVEFVDDDMNRTEDQPVFTIDYRLLRDGEYITADRLPFVISKQAAAVLNPSVLTAFAFVHAYKNEPLSFRLHSIAADYLENMDPTNEDQCRIYTELFDRAQKHPLICNGFGGSTQKSDQNARGYSNTTYEEPAYYLGFNQRFSNKSNAGLLEAAEKKRMIAIFICKDKWGDEKLHPSKNKKKGKEAADAEASSTEEKEEAEPAPALMERDEDEEDEEGEGEDQQNNENDQDYLELLTEDDVKELEAKHGDDHIGLKSRLQFLGYFRVVFLGTQTLTRDEIIERFAKVDMQAYYERNLFNVSHMEHGCICVKLENVSTAEQNIENKLKGMKKLETVQVWVEDRRTIAVPYEKVKKCLEDEGRRNPQAPRELFRMPENPQDGVPYLLERHLRQAWFDGIDKKIFADRVESPVDDNQTFVPPEHYLYKFKFEEILRAMSCISGANAYRFKRNLSVYEDTEEGKTYAMPSVQGPSGLLPDPLRMAAIPNPNPDLDVIVQFTSLQHRTYMAHCMETKDMKIEGLRCINGTTMSYNIKKEDLNKDNVCWMLSEMLFMSFVARVTGSVPHLSQYCNRDVPGLCLPTMDTIDHFISFLDVVCRRGSRHSIATVRSTQHKGSIPKKSYKKWMDAFKGVAEHASGFRSVAHHLLRNAGGLDRTKLVSCIANAASKCGEMAGGEKLDFIANKVVCDVEATFPLFAGDGSPGDAYLGWGSNQGLKAVQVPDGEFETYFQQLRKLLMDRKKVTDSQLLSMGYRRDRANVFKGESTDESGSTPMQVEGTSGDPRAQVDDAESESGDGTSLVEGQSQTQDDDDDPWCPGDEESELGSQEDDETIEVMAGERAEVEHNLDNQEDDPNNETSGAEPELEIRSLHGWRPFGRSDAEHWLCKLWLAVVHSHQSRNLSKVKKVFKEHCYPLCIPGEWEPTIAPVMNEIWDAYERCRMDEDMKYPTLLEFVHDVNKILKERLGRRRPKN